MRLPLSLIDCLPPFLRGIYEYQTLADLGGAALDKLERSRRSLVENAFLADINEAGIARWEVMLDLNPADTDTLSERVFRVKAKMERKLPYTFRVLVRLLEQLCGTGNVTVTRDVTRFRLTVRLELRSAALLGEVAALLDDIVPCDMEIDCAPRYRTWGEVKESGLTWGDLKDKTWEEVREREEL